MTKSMMNYKFVKWKNRNFDMQNCNWMEIRYKSHRKQ